MIKYTFHGFRKEAEKIMKKMRVMVIKYGYAVVEADTERKPSILENNVNGIRFSVHKHIYCGDQWLLTCRELGAEQVQLHTENIEEAKKLGIKKMKELLNSKIKKFQEAIKQLEN